MGISLHRLMSSEGRSSTCPPSVSVMYVPGGVVHKISLHSVVRFVAFPIIILVVRSCSCYCTTPNRPVRSFVLKELSIQIFALFNNYSFAHQCAADDCQPLSIISVAPLVCQSKTLLVAPCYLPCCVEKASIVTPPRFFLPYTSSSSLHCHL